MKNRLKITYNSPTILSFVLICLFVTILGVLTQNKSTELLFSVYKCSLKNPLAYIRVFTHIFGHSGFEHFLVMLCICFY